MRTNRTVLISEPYKQLVPRLRHLLHRILVVKHLVRRTRTCRRLFSFHFHLPADLEIVYAAYLWYVHVSWEQSGRERRKRVDLEGADRLRGCCMQGDGQLVCSQRDRVKLVWNSV